MISHDGMDGASGTIHGSQGLIARGEIMAVGGVEGWKGPSDANSAAATQTYTLHCCLYIFAREGMQVGRGRSRSCGFFL